MKLRLYSSIAFIACLCAFPRITVAGPDLYISEFELQPVTPIQDSRVRVRIGVYNKGNAKAGAFTLTWLPGENYRDPGCTWRVHRVASRGGKVFECTYFYPSWYAQIKTKAVADLAGEVQEDDERNNSRLMSIKVQKP